LKQFEGTLLFISHDVHFIRALATSVLHINAGQLTPYCGGYQYYLDKSRATSERGALIAGATTQPIAQPASAPAEQRSREKDRERKRFEAEERQHRARARKAQEHKVATLEKKIAELESRQRELTAKLEDPATYECAGKAVGVNRDLTHVTEELESLTREWESLAPLDENATPSNR
jgi:ATP-binding cassette, subfamily F, member 3